MIWNCHSWAGGCEAAPNSSPTALRAQRRVNGLGLLTIVNYPSSHVACVKSYMWALIITRQPSLNESPKHAYDSTSWSQHRATEQELGREQIVTQVWANRLQVCSTHIASLASASLPIKSGHLAKTYIQSIFNSNFIWFWSNRMCIPGTDVIKRNIFQIWCFEWIVSDNTFLKVYPFFSLLEIYSSSPITP